MNPRAVAEAEKILREFSLYPFDGNLFLSDNQEGIKLLFDSVMDLVQESPHLLHYLPQQEFVHPTKQYLAGDPGWVGHFREIDNRKFMLSDLYDFLKLFVDGKIEIRDL